jgi:hypothetical protein
MSYSSCWSFHLLREEFLSALIHSPPSLVGRIGPSRFHDGLDGDLYERLNIYEPNNYQDLVNKAIS